MNKQWLLLWAMWISGIISLMSCITPRKGPAKALREAQALAPFDALIVPGIPYNGAGWDSVMKGRVLWSWILYKNGYVKNVIYSGDAVYTPYPEAYIMGLYGKALGIPAEHIFYDTVARHSTENVFYSYRLAQRLGFKSVALGTDPFQAFLLRGFTRRRFGSPIHHLPFIIDSLQRYHHLQPVIDAAALKRPPGWISITRQDNLWKRFRAAFGKEIDWTPYPGRKLGPL